MRQWPRDGRPDNPRAWLIRAARNKAVDDRAPPARARSSRPSRRPTAPASPTTATLAAARPAGPRRPPAPDLHLLPPGARPSRRRSRSRCARWRASHRGDRARVPGARRHDGAAARARQAEDPRRRIPYRVPDDDELPERVDAVMAVVYLVFNEGYAATSGDDAGAARARRRGDPPRTAAGRAACRSGPRRGGSSRSCCCTTRGARRASTPDGRSRPARGAGPDALGPGADRRGPGAGRRGAARAAPPTPSRCRRRSRRSTPRAARAADTDWPQIVALYERLSPCSPRRSSCSTTRSPWRWPTGPPRACACSTSSRRAARCRGYHLLPAARADLLRRLGRRAEAAGAYEQALALVGNEAERRYLQRRLDELAR